VSYYLYKHRSRLIVTYHKHNQSKLFFPYFLPQFSFLLSFTSLNLLATTTTHWVVMDLVPPSGQMPLGREKDALARADSALDCCQSQWNWTLRFTLLQAGASSSCSFHVQTHFGDSAGELTTSSTLSTKGGNSSTNRSNLDKNNILKPTFDTLTEEGRKAFEAYLTNLEELFLSCCELT
jgi:hypothetical protein